MQEDLEQIKQTFINECSELLQEMESILMVIESGADPGNDAVNALFRSVHTIKGTSGMFGFERVVEFSHVVEHFLDQARNGKVDLDEDSTVILLESRDHLSDLIQMSASEQEITAETLAKSERIINSLKSLLGEAGTGGSDSTAPASSAASEAAPPAAPVERETSGEGAGSPGLRGDTWVIHLAPHRDLFLHGLDPLSFVRYLGEMGEIVHLSTITDDLPGDKANFDPESCYLSFIILLESDTADEQSIADVFEFMIDSCELEIFPPDVTSERIDRLLAKLKNEKSDVRAAFEGNVSEETPRINLIESSESAGEPEAEAQQPGQEETPPEETISDESEVLSEAAKTESVVTEKVTAQEPEISPTAATKEKPTSKPVAEASDDGVEALLEKHRSSQSTDRQFLRVEAQKLDRLINLVGELVVSGANIMQIATNHQDDEMVEAASSMDRLIGELREESLKVRMVPIGETFRRYNRVVREISKELGKSVELVISGGDTELDKTVVEKIGDPLIHMIRNAVDHGIETPAVREAAGKPSRGRLELNAYHETGSIVIEVKDDGAGLDKDKILEKARRKGLVDENKTLSDDEIYDILFMPGFSTASNVTNISGRGVGMDVVKKSIEALRGITSIGSVKGEGTTVSVRLPLTLAIIDGFMVKVRGANYILPLDMVVECIALTDDINSAESRNYINLRGEVLPYLDLAKFFYMLNKEGTVSEREKSVVVVQYGRNKGGLIVEELLGEYQTVIKPLGRIFGKLRGLTGMSILGTGEVAMILDVPSLLQLAQEKEQAQLV